MGLAIILILGSINVGFAALGQQQGTSPEPPANSTKIQVEPGEEGSVQYKYEPGTPLTIMTQNTNIVMNSNTVVQLKYSEQSQISVRYLGVDVEAEDPVNLEVTGDCKPEAAPVASDGLGEYYRFQSNDSVTLTLKAFVYAQDYEESLGRPVAQERLTWAYLNGGEWTPVVSHVDDRGNIVAEGECGQWTIREMREGELPAVVPGVSTQVRSQVRALNYTEVEPQGFKYALSEGEQTMFMFKNTAMVFGSTQPLQLKLSAENKVQNSALGIQLKTNTATMLNVSMTAAPIGGAKEAQGVGIYMNIEHNATGVLKATLSMPVEVEALKAKYGSTFDPNQLKWAWWNGEMWMEVPSTLSEGVLTAETDHFSTWTIVASEAVNPVLPQDNTPATDYTWYIVGGAVVIVTAGLFLFLRGRK